MNFIYLPAVSKTFKKVIVMKDYLKQQLRTS